MTDTDPVSTFIDDLFAFTIKMPILHRLATLRDDVIFFVYLYQSWKYKVDYSRVNEFGQGPDEETDVVKEQDKETTEVKKAIGDEVEAKEAQTTPRANGVAKKRK